MARRRGLEILTFGRGAATATIRWAGEIATADAIDFAGHLADANIINNSWGGGAPSDAITGAQLIQRIRNAADDRGSSLDFGSGKLNTGRLVPHPPREREPCEPAPQIICDPL